MERSPLKFSLVLATVGRTEELNRFLDHLGRQTYRDFELIIVDQNPAGTLDSLVRHYQDQFPILYFRAEVGLSRARNLGLQHVSGDIIGFPDDDCWYGPDTLERVVGVLKAHPEYNGVTGMPVDDSYACSFPSFPRVSGIINKKNVWRRAISITIFLRSTLVREVGDFDESLGAGSKTGKFSAEETDYLIRAIESGFNIHYCADLVTYHRYPESTYDSGLIRKVYGYSVGFGSVLKKHNYPLSFVCYFWFRALGGAVVSLLTLNFAKSHYHFAIFKGRVLGWLG